MKINLYNRDGADLWLEKTNKKVEPRIYKWKLKVDKNHDYCLEYMRIIGDYEAVDPSGGPFISISDEYTSLDDKKIYKIVNIENPVTFWISERNNDRENDIN